ncbi:MAG: alpha/beta hydrolase [Gemmatimonadota bacterium]
MRQAHLTIARKARYATLGDGGAGLRQVWFVCHGYGQLAANFLDLFASLDDGSRLLVAPEGLSRFYVDHEARKVGASWMTSEDRLTDIAEYVAYLDRLHDVVFGDAPRDSAGPPALEAVSRDEVELVALGFSQGAATVSRWTAFGRARVDRLILWGGLVPPDLDLELHGARLRAARLTLVVGEEDEYVSRDAVERTEVRLREAGVPWERVTFPGGHRLDRKLLARLARA